MSRKRQHIVLATGLYPPQIGGPATYAALLRRELPKRGHIVSVVNFGDVRHLPKGVRHVVYAYRLLRRSLGADVVFAQDPVSVGVPAYIVSRVVRTGFVIRIAGDYAWEQARQRFGVYDTIDEFQTKQYGWQVQLLRRIQSFVADHADVIITPSKYFKGVVERWGVPAERIVVIYNGIDTSPIDITRHQARRALGIPDNARVLVSSGRLVPWKGFKTLIDVVRVLEDERPGPHHLYIIGDGPDYDKLRSYIEEKGLTTRVFLVGAREHDALQQYLRAADLFVLNTSFESFSFQTVEALNAGRAVVTTYIGNLPEIIDDHTDGVLLEPDNAEQFRDVIARLMDDDALREKLEHAARKKASLFSIDRTLDQLTELLRSL